LAKNSKIKKNVGPNAIRETQIAIKIEPMLSPIPVIRWKIEKTDVKTFLWIERWGDKGLLLIIEKIFIIVFKYLFFGEIQKKIHIYLKYIKKDICGKKCG
jgi:hypothetical protein